MTKGVNVVEVGAGAALRCPLCDYDVRGLPEPRCPECGHAFDWEELTDPARQRLPWLFEHRRFTRGYLATAGRLLWPWRFWRKLRPGHTARSGRLAGFFVLGWGAALCIYLAAVVVVCSVQVQVESRAGRALMSRSAASMGFTFGGAAGTTLPATLTLGDLQARWAGTNKQAYLDQTYPLLGSSPAPLFLAHVRTLAETMTVESELIAFMPLAFLGAAALVLAVMRQSFSRAKLGWRHVFRVAVYGVDPLLLALLTAGMAAYCVAQLVHPFGAGPPQVPALVLWAIGAFAVTAGLKLEAGVRAYLGLRHGWAVAIAAMVLVPLLWTAMALPILGWPF